MTSIGGVGVAAWSDAVVVSQSSSRHYAPFRASLPGGESRPPDIDVQVLLTPPATPPGPLLFDCDGAWSAYADEMAYRIVFGGADAGTAHLVARSNRETSRVVIHVGQSWARHFDQVDADGERCVADPFRYPLDQLLLMNHLGTRGGVIVHSAGLQLDGAGFVFPGASGAGKTTLCGLLDEAGLGEHLLSDDRMILRGAQSGSAEDDPNGFDAWGTPWPGDAGIARNVSVPLRALCFLVQDGEPAVVPLAPAEGAQRMFPVISCPWYDRELVAAVLDTIDRLVAATPCYEFHFPRDGRAADLFRRLAATLV